MRQRSINIDWWSSLRFNERISLCPKKRHVSINEFVLSMTEKLVCCHHHHLSVSHSLSQLPMLTWRSSSLSSKMTCYLSMSSVNVPNCWSLPFDCSWSNKYGDERRICKEFPSLALAEQKQHLSDQSVDSIRRFHSDICANCLLVCQYLRRHR